MVRRGITTFRDDKLKRGEEIQPELLKNQDLPLYVDSRWCLEELATIMECRQKYGQIVWPIFYHVDLGDVHKQTGSFGNAFTEHEKNWKNQVQRWWEALIEAGNISGFHVEVG